MGDSLHITARTAISLIPVFSGAVLELFNEVIAPPLEIRKQKWMEDITDAVNELMEKKHIEYETLRNNEQFISTMLQASTMAMRNHQREKLESLKNAVLNSGLPGSPDESLQQMFLTFVDYFSVYHIKFLSLFQNPIKWFSLNDMKFPNLMAGGLSSVVEDAFPELRDKRAIYDLIWTDLYSRNLTNTSGLHTTMSSSGLQAKRTSEIGDRFLKYITRPF